LNSGIDYAARNIRKTVLHRLAVEKEILRGLERNAEALSPSSILSRGFSITRRNGRAVRSISLIRENDTLLTELSDGEVESKVINRNR
jgi:exodeoxyribonuclease VII large subunit